MLRRRRLSLALLSLLFTVGLNVAASSVARADVLFEGYSKVLLDGVHVGYVVQRYEFDPKKQEFSAAYFLKTNQLGGNVSESLRARSNAKFRPLSYSYIQVAGDKLHTIDATFKNDMMTANINDGGKKEVQQKKISKDNFLSSFLAFVMLAGKEGIKKGVNYRYQAIAEEDAGIYSGNALISAEETMLGLNVFKVLNTFKGVQFMSYVTYKGEIIATRSPVQKVSTELVASAGEATQGMSFNSNTISQIFGGVPRGFDNPISRRGPGTAASTAPAPAVGSAPAQPKKLPAAGQPTAGANPKQEGIPGGQGITIKGQPDGSPSGGNGD